MLASATPPLYGEETAGPVFRFHIPRSCLNNQRSSPRFGRSCQPVPPGIHLEGVSTATAAPRALFSRDPSLLATCSDLQSSIIMRVPASMLSPTILAGVNGRQSD